MPFVVTLTSFPIFDVIFHWVLLLWTYILGNKIGLNFPLLSPPAERAQMSLGQKEDR